MRRYLTLLITLFAVLTLSAATEIPDSVAAETSPAALKISADSAYLDKQYVKAAEGYQSLVAAALAEGLEPAADVYYNLGNTEYRLKHYPQAVLAYLRALRIDPGHEDARYNLSLVRTRLTNRLSQPSEMFFISWLKDWVTSRSVEHWVLWSFFWLVLCFGCFGVYRTVSHMALKKVGFFGALLSLLVFVCVTAFAAVQRYRYFHNDEAVITLPETQLYGSPTKSSKEVRKLHEGTTVRLLDSHTKGWQQLELADGTMGWITDHGFERVVQPLSLAQGNSN